MSRRLTRKSTEPIGASQAARDALAAAQKALDEQTERKDQKQLTDAIIISIYTELTGQSQNSTCKARAKKKTDLSGKANEKKCRDETLRDILKHVKALKVSEAQTKKRAEAAEACAEKNAVVIAKIHAESMAISCAPPSTPESDCSDCKGGFQTPQKRKDCTVCKTGASKRQEANRRLASAGTR